MSENTKFHRGRVTSKQDQCLRLAFLKDELVVREMVDTLYSRGVLDDHDRQSILGAESSTQREQNVRLLDTIRMRTPSGFEHFVQALHDTGHHKAYTAITDTLKACDCRGEAGGDMESNASNRTTVGESARQDRKGVNTGATGELSDAAKEAARGLVAGLLDKDRQSEILDLLHRLAVSPPEESGNNEFSHQHLDSLHHHMKAMERRLGQLGEELHQRKTWDKQREEELARLQSQLTKAHARIQALSRENNTKARQLQEAETHNKQLLDTVRLPRGFVCSTLDGRCDT
jgi:hypothetical protein